MATAPMQVTRLEHATTVPVKHGAPSVVAIGNFDGVHVGHMQVLRAAQLHAERLQVPLSVLTFAPHPREFFQPAQKPWVVFPLAQRLALLREAGVQRVWLQRFDARFAAMPAQAFAQTLLAQQLRAAHVVTGANFVFGAKRTGDSAQLASWLADAGVGYSPIAIHAEAAQIVSSTAIRHALKAGDMACAGALLGRPYSCMARVGHGRKEGRMLGYPTANLALSPRYQPRLGVYVVWARLEGAEEWLPAIASYGRRPMFDNGGVLLEVHVLNTQGSPNYYGQRMEVAWGPFLRAEAVFESREALLAQMAQDCHNAQQFHARHATPAAWLAAPQGITPHVA